eukprot:CAMPEP_0117669938 /NCGR_PEP_ID=MMETSP0804-20121206/12436_1 /TAXON_ID=1074897 /ORGANISM="Tetraselmis astigmatica, Strain CCMP880" /LENGTH=220 /DNA_ID=CAMNT_0005478103 /DNA_START=128 /DNA_END=788 /DNA_ORIENTATION=-
MFCVQMGGAMCRWCNKGRREGKRTREHFTWQRFMHDGRGYYATRKQRPWTIEALRGKVLEVVKYCDLPCAALECRRPSEAGSIGKDWLKSFLKAAEAFAMSWTSLGLPPPPSFVQPTHPEEELLDDPDDSAAQEMGCILAFAREHQSFLKRVDKIRASGAARAPAPTHGEPTEDGEDPGVGEGPRHTKGGAVVPSRPRPLRPAGNDPLILVPCRSSVNVC